MEEPRWKSLVRRAVVVATPKNEFGLPLEVWFWVFKSDGKRVYLLPSIKRAEVYNNYGVKNDAPFSLFMTFNFGGWARIALDKGLEDPPRKYLWFYPFFVPLEGEPLRRLTALSLTEPRELRRQTPLKFLSLFKNVRLKYRFYLIWSSKFYSLSGDESWSGYPLWERFKPSAIKEFIISASSVDAASVDPRNGDLFEKTAAGLFLSFAADQNPDPETELSLGRERSSLGEVLNDKETFLKVNAALVDGMKVIDLFYEALGQG